MENEAARLKLGDWDRKTSRLWERLRDCTAKRVWDWENLRLTQQNWNSEIACLRERDWKTLWDWETNLDTVRLKVCGSEICDPEMRNLELWYYETMRLRQRLGQWNSETERPWDWDTIVWYRKTVKIRNGDWKTDSRDCEPEAETQKCGWESVRSRKWQTVTGIEILLDGGTETETLWL